MSESVNLIKMSGEQEPFSEQKYRESLRRAGASEALIDQVLAEVHPQLREGMTTKELYKLTHQLLDKKAKHGTSGRYHIKQALIKLGPSGYPFEHYIGRLFKRQGYTVDVGIEVRGICVSHEVDVVGVKGDERLLVECKFHGRQGARSGVQVPLYVSARFEDVMEFCTKEPECQAAYTGCWIVSNTRFTTTAVQYAECRKLTVLSWDYPKGKGLASLIDEFDLHPITCLSKLPKKMISTLLKNGIVLCSDVVEKKEELVQLGVAENIIDDVVEEARAVCEGE